MSRSNWKGPFLASALLKNKSSKIWSRSSVIPSSLIGETVYIHNGKEFKRVFITREKIGFKFGDFSLSRKILLKTKSIKKK